MESLRRIVLGACLAVLAGAFAGFLGSSSCHVGIRTCDDDDFDDDFDDDCDDDDDHDDDHGATAGPPPAGATVEAVAGRDSDAWYSSETSDGALAWPAPTDLDAYRLHGFELVPSDGPPAHPVRALERRADATRALSLFALAGSTTVGREEIRAVCDRILLANEDLLGLPTPPNRGAGELRFSRILYDEVGLAAVYAQLAPGTSEPLAGAELAFVFDRLGRLARITNTTLVELPGNAAAARR